MEANPVAAVVSTVTPAGLKVVSANSKATSRAIIPIETGLVNLPNIW
jgi:hypothetical protein